MKSLLRQMIFHVLLPLIFGIVIYFLFRKDTWFHQYFFSVQMKFPLIEPQNTAGKIMAFNLPDFCWSYSFASALFLWKRWMGSKWVVFPVLVLSLLLVAEFIQLYFSHWFTFDWADIFAALLAYVLSYKANDRYESN